VEIKEFINTCIENGYAWKKEKCEDVDGFMIGSEKYDTVAHFIPEAIQKNEWPALHKQIVQGKNIHHLTRIVGYFSRVENWNKSKLGELKDRHRGDYKVGK